VPHYRMSVGDGLSMRKGAVFNPPMKILKVLAGFSRPHLACIGPSWCTDAFQRFHGPLFRGRARHRNQLRFLAGFAKGGETSDFRIKMLPH
jgi:hypothetical protein